MQLRIVLLLVLLLLTNCTYPRDPEQTLEKVLTTGILMVGLSEGAPWVVRAGGQPAGVEVDLVRSFAHELGVQVQWRWGTQDELMQALNQFELDLVIGGLSSASAWQSEVGITSPYFVEDYKIGVPQPQPVIDHIAQVEIAVERGSAVAAYVEAEDGIPVPVDNLADVDSMPIAAPLWLVEALGFVPTQIVIHKVEHVMAVPPGENRWLLRLEEFLQQPHTIKRLAQRQMEIELETNP